MTAARQTLIPRETVMPKGNTETGFLKLLALACMIVDHVGAVFFPSIMEMRIIGRIAFPLYIWCVVVGCCYTRSMEKYLLRLIVVGIVAQPCYMLCFNHQWNEFNVFFTMILGVMGVYGIRLKRFGSQVWLPAIAVLIATVIDIDYGWKGVALILLAYLSRGSRAAVGAVFAAFCLFWGQGTYTLTSLFGVPLNGFLNALPAGTKALAQTLLKLQFSAVLALPFILIPTGVKWRMPMVMTYAAYPGHLLIIGIIRVLMQNAR